MTEAKRDLAKSFITWLESQRDQAGERETRAGAVERGMATAPRGQRLMTVKEVAEYLQVKEDTVYLWVKDRTLRCRRVKGEIRFKFEELEEDSTPKQKTIEKARLRMVK